MTKDDSTTASADRRRASALCAVLAMSLTVVCVSCDDGSSSTAAFERGRTRPSIVRAPRPPASPATSPASSPSSVPAATATPAGSTLEDEIVARYVGFWDARLAANGEVPNPDDARLREFATGEQLERVVAETRANLDQGRALRQAVNPSGMQRVTVIEVDGDHAVVQECVVTDGVIVRLDTGKVVDDAVATHSVRGELVRVDGIWKVSATQLIQRWEGVAGCARDS